MHVPTNVKSPNNISKWQMGFNSAFKGLILGEQQQMYNTTVYVFFMTFLLHVSAVSSSSRSLHPNLINTYSNSLQ